MPVTGLNSCQFIANDLVEILVDLFANEWLASMSVYCERLVGIHVKLLQTTWLTPEACSQSKWKELTTCCHGKLNSLLQGEGVRLRSDRALQRAPTGWQQAWYILGKRKKS